MSTVVAEATMQSSAGKTDLVHQLLMEVTVQGGDDWVALVMPEVQHPLGLKLHYDNYVQGMSVEVVIRGGADVDKALDVAARLGVAHLLGILVCSGVHLLC